MDRSLATLAATALIGCGSTTLVERPTADSSIDTTVVADTSPEASEDVAVDTADAVVTFPCDGDWELVDGRGQVTSCCGGRTCLGRCQREAGARCDCGGLVDCPLGTACCLNKDSGATGCGTKCLSTK